ncbi:glycosyltransferase family 39 protein [Smaragdicoccus niigatensis]|uniref:glycosyltransferase family 39 protein n=1 Tax=Smaragdicoccus niigatensis TaxID=359359 RepID=UPI0003602D7A|nr:glycosyltransferase family 39 protein [Smaragdicoccus niigatensis]
MTTALQERVGARSRTWLLATLSLCTFAALTVVQIVACWRYPSDYDEGVYLQTLRAVADGFEPYRDVFLAQPPVFIDLALPFGAGIVAARLTVVAFWAAAIIGIYVVGSLHSKKSVGLLAAALLALDPLFLNAGRTLQAEVPALALAIWSIAAGLYAVRHSRPATRLTTAALCGTLFALAVATKFIAAPALVPLIVIAVRNRPIDRRVVLSALAGAVATTALVLGRFADSLAAFYDQTVRFHQQAQAGFGGNHTARLDMWLTALHDPLISAGVIGFVIAAALSWRSNMLPLSWFGATAAALLVLAPLWEHHFAALAPAASLLLATLIASAARWSKQCAVIAVAVMTVAAGSASVTAFHSDDPYPRWAMTELERVTASERYIVTDDQFLASKLGLRVPPELVDTSLVRIETGYLTLEQVTGAMTRHKAQIVILTRGRLRLVPGFVGWIKASCTPVSGLLVARVFSCR